MLHLQDARQLTLSAATCPLCAMIIDAVLQYDRAKTAISNSGCLASNDHGNAKKPAFEQHLIDQPIYLRPKYDHLRRPFPENKSTPDSPQLTDFLVYVPVDCGILTGALRLYALPGNTHPNS